MRVSSCRTAEPQHGKTHQNGAKVAPRSYVCEVMCVEVSPQGPTNRCTVSSQDRDCHTAPLSTRPAHNNDFFLEPPRGYCRVITERCTILLLSSSKRTNFVTPPNSQWLASCSSIRANSHNTNNENCAAFSSFR